MNSFILIGKVLEEPHTKEIQGSKKLTKLMVREKRSYRNLEGNYDSDTYEITLWGNGIEELKKDDLIAIKGRIQSYQFEKDNNTYHNVELIGEKVSVYHELI